MATASGGPSVLVRFLGDISNLKNVFSGFGEQVTSTTGRMRSAVTGAISGLESTGIFEPLTDAFHKIDDAMVGLAGNATRVGEKFLAIGGATAAIGAGLQQLGSTDQAAQQQLQTAIEATGHSYLEYGDEVEKAITHQEKFGNTANQTQDALRLLTQATNDPA